MRSLFEAATRMSIEVDHPAYDCIYLALAIESSCQFVTADEQLLRKLQRGRQHTLVGRAMALHEAATLSFNRPYSKPSESRSDRRMMEWSRMFVSRKLKSVICPRE